MGSVTKLTFSVAMCVYGGDNPEYFRTAIESVYNQTRKPDEVVLTVDGPVPEEIEKVISDISFKQSNLKIVRLSQNMGHGIARKEGINACSMPLIAIADADDINLPIRFETQVRCFENDNKLSVVGSAHKKFIGDIDNVIAVSSRPQNHDDIVKLMKCKCPVTQACVMFTKEIYERAGGYIDWYCAEDYYLWIRMYEAGGKFHNCPESLVQVRTSQDQYKRRGGWKYFKSTAGISNYMRKKRIISTTQHIKNVFPRFILQVIMPSSIRGYIRNKIIQRSTFSLTKKTMQ